MSQHDFTIANQTASSARTDINNALQALASCNSGSSAPSTTYANMLWYETDTNLLKIRNEANSAWVSLLYIDQGNSKVHIIDGTEVANASGSTTAVIDTHSNATWEAGTNTEKRLVSPAQIKGAIESLNEAVGIDQTWQTVTRSSNTWYQAPSRPIMIGVSCTGATNEAHVGATTGSAIRVAYNNAPGSGFYEQYHISLIIPANHYYRVKGNISEWRELR